MKKNYVLLSGLVLVASLGFSQNLMQSNVNTAEKLYKETYIAKAANNNNLNKAPGDTLFYEDFDASIPAGWTVTNPSANGNDWIWSSAAPGGQYSTNITALASTTGANGFMQLPADNYNTPFPVGGAVAMDTWFSSPAITLVPKAAVLLAFEHSQRYCCQGTNELVVEVSNDNVNWTTIDATGPAGSGGRGPNTATPNGERLEFNVSAVLANQTTGYVRFRSTGNSHYYWMVDDVVLLEGNANNMILEDIDIKFHPDYDITPIYKTLPIAAIPEILFEGATFNAGSNVQTNVNLNVDVVDGSNNVVYAASTSIGASVPSLQRDTVQVMNPFFTFTPGTYNHVISVTSDSVNQVPGTSWDDYSVSYSNDSVVALDRGDAFFQGSSGPVSYVAGGQDGDIAVQLMILDSGVTATVNSVSIYIANRTENDGVQLQPRLYTFEEDSATIDAAISTNPIASSPFTYTVVTADLGTWVTLPFFIKPTGGTITDGAFYFGVEQVGGGTTGAEMWIGRDVGQESIAPAFSSAFFLNDPANPGWAALPRLLGIRFNGDFRGPISVGTKEVADEKLDFTVAPNPSTGLFNLNLNTNGFKTFNMNVRNMLGQAVTSEVVTVNGSLNKTLDLTALDKGVYFITLENGVDRLVQKVVVK